MLTAIIFFIIGLVVGWFFLPTPQFAKDWMALLIAKITGKPVAVTTTVTTVPPTTPVV